MRTPLPFSGAHHNTKAILRLKRGSGFVHCHEFLGLCVLNSYHDNYNSYIVNVFSVQNLITIQIYCCQYMHRKLIVDGK